MYAKLLSGNQYYCSDFVSWEQMERIDIEYHHRRRRAVPIVAYSQVWSVKQWNCSKNIPFQATPFLVTDLSQTFHRLVQQNPIASFLEGEGVYFLKVTSLGSAGLIRSHFYMLLAFPLLLLHKRIFLILSILDRNGVLCST